MLEVQKYLKSGKNIVDLESEFAIKTTFHPNLPLVILNYNQIESPKTETIVRECRALTLHSKNYDVVAKSMNRFFNWGEVEEEQADFDFSDFIVQSKEDGSLVVLYYFDGEWHANTRGSFALDNLQYQNFTWRDGFCKAMSISSLADLKGRLDESVAYICEFCSPWNKVVRKYTEPKMCLLTAFRGLHELSPDEVDQLNDGLFFRPERFSFSNVEEIQEFLLEQSEKDVTFEGVVIRDKNGNRWKIKNLSYVSLHHLRGEGDNLFNPKHLLPFILSGEKDELLTYFNECRPIYERTEKIVNQWMDEIQALWDENKHILEQKEFAMKVKHHPLASILFNARKTSCQPKEIFKKSLDILEKRLKDV